VVVFLYIDGKIPASFFTIELTVINFAAPSLVMLLMLLIAFKFSGSPLRSQVYYQKLKLLQIAVLVWSIARYLRAIGGMYESKMFYGMILGLKDQ
jgi:hypothetical protein